MEAGEAFEQWKLEIRVKFRALEDMHVLDSTRQSGGERSVSTMWGPPDIARHVIGCHCIQWTRIHNVYR